MIELLQVKRKLTKPEDLTIHDGIRAVNKEGDDLLKTDEPSVLGTRPIFLSRTHPIKAINLLLPPGISKFYVQRLNKNEIRFLISTNEITRLAEKAEKIMEAKVDEVMKKDAEGIVN